MGQDFLTRMLSGRVRIGSKNNKIIMTRSKPDPTQIRSIDTLIYVCMFHIYVIYNVNMPLHFILFVSDINIYNFYETIFVPKYNEKTQTLCVKSAVLMKVNDMKTAVLSDKLNMYVRSMCKRPHITCMDSPFLRTDSEPVI
jgi:hypothetical protein